MLVFEFKAYGKQQQFSAIDEAIKTVQFIRNKALRFWMDNEKVNKFDLNKYSAILAKEFPFCNELNSMARQSSAERAWSAITRFYDNCKKKVPGKKGFPQFQKNNRSVEYKTSGWKLANDRKSISFTDKKGIGKLKLKGTRDLHFYQITQIKRVRLVKRADGHYVQFCVQVDRSLEYRNNWKCHWIRRRVERILHRLQRCCSRKSTISPQGRTQIKEVSEACFQARQRFQE